MMNIVNFDSDVCALTDTGLVRSHNEDSNRVERTDNGDLFVVCDGMGGHVGGATASKIGVNSICGYVREHECTIPGQFLVKALEFANRNIFKESRRNSELRGMGTTACVALVRGDKVWYAHVGDSRIYYYNSKNNILYRLTKDHSVVQALVDQGMITEAEAEHHPEKNKIRKALGIKETVEAEPCQMPLIPSDGDVLLICSDGLSGMMDEDDILEVLKTTPNVNEAGKTLIELAKAGGGTDNITVQIIKFSGTGVREAVFDAKNKGVTSLMNLEKKNTRKRIWFWICTIVSALALLLAAFVFLHHSSDSSTLEQGVAESIDDTIQVDAYLDEVKGLNPEIYSDAGKTYLFYQRRVSEGGSIEGVRVSKDTKTYEKGKFTKTEIRVNSSVTFRYDPVKDSVEKFDRYGNPR